MNLRFLALSVVSVAVLACNGADTDSDTDVVVEPEGPELSWTPPPEPLSASDVLEIAVTAEDPEGVARVVTYFRTEGSTTWSTAPDMTFGEGTWNLTLESANIEAPGLELYFKGEDADGNVSYLPEEGGRGPFVVPVNRQGLALPYFQDFDAVPNELLREVGWELHANGFEGYAFQLTTARSWSGSSSVVHRRAPDTITGEIEDWLISPTFDLTSLTASQVSWREFGDAAELADHSLWISTGSPDPDDGEFVELTALDSPLDGEWGRSQVVDLSAWAAEPAVTLAWVFKGVDTDQWWIDDVSVRALAPDLRVTDITSDVDPLAPGDSATLSVTIENRTLVDATDVVLTVTADDGATFGEPVSVSLIAGESSVDVAVPVTIDSDFYDNAWIDLEVEAVSGDEVWTSDRRLLVGQASVASVAYTIAGESDQLVRLSLGTGDPEEPLLQIPLDQSVRSPGSYDVEFDITDYAEYLPPEPGERRWWVQVEGGFEGSIDSFAIRYGGEDMETTDVGPFTGIAASVYYLPAPPEPVFRSSSPGSVSPGDTFSWNVQLYNAGAGTSGPTTVTLSSVDPDVTISSAGPFSIGSSGGWTAGSFASANFGATVSDTRKTSVPVRMIATVTDDYESFEVPIDLRVPWPVLSVTGIVIDDWADGDADGLLDAGESVNLDIDVTNRGDLPSFGPVSCSMSVLGGTASVTLDETEGYLGIINAGTTENEDDFALTVVSGSDGDTIDLQLDCVDRSETYVVPFSLELGERPWISITPRFDAEGDNLKSYRFDFRQGFYRSDGETLEFILESAVPHGGLTGLFLDVWGTSAGSSYDFYNFTIAGSTGTVNGYRSGFSRLDDLTVTELDSQRVHVAIELEPLGLRLDSLTLGFAAGFCGGDAQYCDHYPDAWGAPYSGLSTSRWVSVDW